MNTPAHLLLAGAVYGRADHRGSLMAAILGAAVPDASLYAMVGWHLLILGTAPEVVFGTLYFSDAWQAVFAIDNSLLLWLAVMAVAQWRRWRLVLIFAGAAALHILFDLPLHAGDGRPHFWPITMWVYDSPVSYWDMRAGAAIIGPLTLAISAVCTVVLWRRFAAWGWRIILAGLLLAEAMSSRFWLLVF